MRKNDAITFEVDRNDLEEVLGNLAQLIAETDRVMEALKGVVDIIRTALWEDENPVEEPDCENCDLPCRHNPNFAGIKPASPDAEERELLEELKAISEALELKDTDMDSAEQKLKETIGIGPVNSKADPVKNEDPDEEDEAESLAIELLKAIFSALTDVIENGE